MDGTSVYVFDAYGTLLDVHSAVNRHAEAIGPDASRLSQLWRSKQLEYSWTRSLMGRYADFWSLTEQALDHAAQAVLGGIAPALRTKLLDAYRCLDAYPEVSETLRRLKESGVQTAILSNGAPGMLAAALGAARLDDLLDAVLSVDSVRVFKTHPRTYAMATERFACSASDVSFQSSNRWDIAGARAFGFRTAWINRAGVPDEYPDLPPERVLADLRSL